MALLYIFTPDYEKPSKIQIQQDRSEPKKYLESPNPLNIRRRPKPFWNHKSTIAAWT